MRGISRFYLDKVLQRPRLTVLLVFLLTVPFTYYFAQQSHNNHVSIFFAPDDPLYVAYKEFQETYGNEEYALIAVDGAEIFSNATLGILRGMTTALEQVPGVERVVSLTNVEEFVGTDDMVSLQTIVPDGELTMAQLAAVRTRAMENRIVKGRLLTEDGDKAAIYVELESLSEADKVRTVRGISEIIRDTAAKGVRLHCSGLSMVEVELNHLSEEDFKTFIPVLLVLIFIANVFLLRRFSLAVLCHVNLIVILMWGIGLYVWSGERFNMVTTIMGAVLLAISIADSVHILSQLKESFHTVGQKPMGAIRHTLAHVWAPCLFTSLTTAAGFISFSISHIRPVAILGIFTAIGVLLAFIISVTLLPGLLGFAPRRLAKMLTRKSAITGSSARSEYFMRALAVSGRLTTRHYKKLFILFLVIMGVCLGGMSRLKFETNSSSYLPDDNPVKRDLGFIEDSFGGAIPWVLLIKAKGDLDFTRPEAVRKVDQIQNGLVSNLPNLTNAFSVADYVKEFNQAFNNNAPDFYSVPKLRSDIADSYEIGDAEVLQRVLSPDYREACVTFQSIWDSNEAAYRMDDFIRKYMAANLGDQFEYYTTGLSTLYLTMDKYIQESQLRSFGVAFVIIFFMMLAICRNFKLAVLAMVPNIFPIVVTLGIMGWVGVPMDVATIMIASVTIGIAVDDTIHFIVWLRRNASSEPTMAAAIEKTFTDVGKPIVITSLLLFMGFFVLVLGSVRPTQAFGVLTALAMLFALIGDLFVLPPLILLLKPKGLVGATPAEEKAAGVDSMQRMRSTGMGEGKELKGV